ncbi:hypothetical protein [Hymenobacter glacieicola]|uniref:Uncharacterized protein n=1 Tax=Hymenobacter glacieicola TaxID=1562124 RepID=A0ABQ1WN47_9BACT|nr:hypothetical protein [Hymenobacter glacieicola]GGG38825.1 hypothetical protein GCM10011378_13900 [Hymenobacter glacieicola]
MFRFLSFFLLALGFAAQTAQAQNRPPVQSVRRHPTERVSPVPGVALPAGVGQDKAEPVPAPTQVLPNHPLPLPSVPSGQVTVGPLDSAQVQPTPRRRATPARSQKRRP